MKNYNKGFVVQGIVAIVALFIVAGGAYYFGIKNQIKENIIQLVDSKTVKEVSIPTPPQIISDIKPSITVTSPYLKYILSFNDKNSITWNYTGLDFNDTLTIGFMNRAETGSTCWIKGITVGNQKLDYIANNVLCENGVKLKVGDEYKISLFVDKYNTGMGVTDDSDNYFKFTSPTLPVTSTQPSITILSPNGGRRMEIWQHI